MRQRMELWVRRGAGCAMMALLTVLCALSGWGQEAVVDASALDGTVRLTPVWRYAAADEAGFAAPGFDDSGWQLLASGAALPGGHGIRSRGAEYRWARLRLRVEGGTQPLAMTLMTSSVFPYAVYANGQLAGESRGFERGVLQHAEPFAIALPRAEVIELAVRMYCPHQDVMRTLPIMAMEVGRRHAMEADARYRRSRDFEDVQIAELISVALSLANAMFAGTMFLARRSRREYLWLALASLCYGATGVAGVVLNYGFASASPMHLLLYRVAGCLSNVFLLEFVPLLTRVKPLRWARGLQAVLAALPPVALYSEPLFAYGLVLTLAAVGVVIAIYFAKALLRRNVEALLLSFPLGLMLVASVLQFGNILFPARVWFPTRFSIGGLGMGADQIPLWLLILSVFGLIQMRFVRVSRTEEQTAAELQAARTIQNLLIPDELPEVAGLRLESVYQPAREVGGDFFQILPLAGGGALVAVGDVSGKGVPAAMTVALLVGTLRAVAERTESPAGILAALNRSLVGRGSGFTTCVLMRVDPEEGSVTAASAGHLNPYLDGRELALEAGLPLGITTEVEYVEESFGFRAGDQLTLVTDGVVEAFEPHTRELFGFARTLAASGLPAAGIAARVAAFTRETAAGTASDDMTILTVAYV